MQDALATLGLLLAAGLVARAIADVVGLPEVLLLVVFGVLLGPSVAGLLDVPLRSIGAELIATVGVSAILFHGGLHLSVNVLRGVAGTLAMLVIPGVLLTTAIVGGAAHVAFGLDWNESLLMGSVLSPTDPAVLIPLFLALGLRAKISQTVIAESALNDPTGAVLAVTLAAGVLGGDASVTGTAWEFVRSLVESVGIGLVAGVLLSAVISAHRVGIWRESAAVAVLAIVVLSYVSLDSAGGSGYLGAFLAGLVVGNMRVFGLRMQGEHAAEMRAFAGNVADIVTLLVFLVLGANLPIGSLIDNIGPELVVVGALMLVARPLVIALCAAPDRRAAWTRNELVFLSWTRETGVVPAALVGVLVAERVPHAGLLADVVAVAVVATLALQAIPAGLLARRLRLLESDP